MSSGRSRQQSRGGRGGGGGGGRDYRRYGGNDSYPRSRGGYRLEYIINTAVNYGQLLQKHFFRCCTILYVCSQCCNRMFSLKANPPIFSNYCFTEKKKLERRALVFYALLLSFCFHKNFLLSIHFKSTSSIGSFSFSFFRNTSCFLLNLKTFLNKFSNLRSFKSRNIF